MLMLDATLVSADQPSLEQRWNRSVEVARVKTLVQLCYTNKHSKDDLRIQPITNVKSGIGCRMIVL